jgi:hypothetical protein
MKNIVSRFCVPVLVILIVSCEKGNNISDAVLEGSWELRSSSSMISSTYPPGNGRIISFTGNKYEMKENGQVIRRGEFKVEEDLTAGESTCLNIAAGKYTSRIIYDNNVNTTKTFFELSENKLTIISGCFAVDAGVSLEYERQ